MLSDFIQHHRTRLHLSPEQLSQNAQVSLQSLLDWEGEKSLPTLEELGSLCSIFGISLEQAIEESGYLNFPNHRKTRFGSLIALFGFPLVMALFTFTTGLRYDLDIWASLAFSLAMYLFLYTMILYNRAALDSFLNTWHVEDRKFSYLSVGPFQRILLPLILVNKNRFTKELQLTDIESITIQPQRHADLIDRAWGFKYYTPRFHPTLRSPIKFHIHQKDKKEIELNFHNVLENVTVISYIHYYLESKKIPVSVQLTNT